MSLIASLNWTAVGSLAALLTFVVYVVIAYLTLKTQRAAALVRLLDELQSPEMREARRAVYRMRPERLLDRMPSPSLQGHSPMDLAELTCHVFNTAGYLARRRQVSRKHLLDLWGPAVIRVRIQCDDVIAARRAQKGEMHPFLWEDFDWLAAKAVAHWPRRLRQADTIKSWSVTPEVLNLEKKHKEDFYDLGLRMPNRPPPW